MVRGRNARVPRRRPDRENRGRGDQVQDDEQTAARANGLGLMPEEIDPQSGELSRMSGQWPGIPSHVRVT